jgi:hypothetical protein
MEIKSAALQKLIRESSEDQVVRWAESGKYQMAYRKKRNLERDALVAAAKADPTIRAKAKQEVERLTKTKVG